MVDAHHLDIRRVSRKVEAHHHDEVRKDQDAAFKVVALSLAINVAEEEDAKDHCDHVPLREDEVEGVVEQVLRFDIAAVDGAEKDEGWYLEEADLQSIGGANFHREGNITIHGEGDGILKNMSATSSSLGEIVLTKNSVVFGTNANKVMPKNFSSMSTLSRTTSTVFTRISAIIA